MGKNKKTKFQPLNILGSNSVQDPVGPPSEAKSESCRSDFNNSETAQMNSKMQVVYSNGSSSNVSKTLGEEDSDTDSDSVLQHNSKTAQTSNAHKVFDKSSKSNFAQPAAPWTSLFKDNRNHQKGITLSVIESQQDEVTLVEEDLEDVESAWGFCLVGYIAGKFPGRKAIIQLCDSWQVSYKFITHDSGWLVFKFGNANDRDKILNGGPYFVFGRPLMLKVMPKCFEFGDEDISVMPVWIQLPGLPIDCWNANALSKITSKVGKPIATDMLTSTKERLSYARVLVEVDASKEQIKTINIKLPNGKTRNQSVVFEHKPKFCSNCMNFGHFSASCKHSHHHEEKQDTIVINSSDGKSSQTANTVEEKQSKQIAPTPQDKAPCNATNNEVSDGPAEENVCHEQDVGCSSSQALQTQTEIPTASAVISQGRKKRTAALKEKQPATNRFAPLAPSSKDKGTTGKTEKNPGKPTGADPNPLS